MSSGFFFRLILAVILVAGLVALGGYIYNLGLAQGAASSLAGPLPEGQTQPSPYFYAPFYRPWGWGWGFGFFGFCFPFLAILLIFAAFRGLFFRGGWRGYGPGGWGWYGKYRGGEGDIPPRVEEWHRKMHASEGENEPPAETASS